jgi:hypothetical protein
VEQPDLDGRPPEHLLAEEGVHVHPREATLLVAGGGCPPRLVVDHRQLPVLRHVEAVEDAPDPQAIEVGLERQLNADRSDRVGVLELEVVADERCRVVAEVPRGLVAQGQGDELRVRPELLPRSIQLAGRGLPRPSPWWVLPEQAVERPVDERALERVRRRLLGEPVDGPQPEGERAGSETGHPRRGQRSRQRQAHPRPG